MIFYGYVDNGEKFIKAKITADTVSEAYKKLELFSEKIEEKFDDYRGKIECLMLLNENKEYIWQTGEDIDECIQSYNTKLNNGR